MALDLLGWTVDNLVTDLFDGDLGLTKFLADAEAGDLVTF
jgi:peroxiredoxin family protein